MNQVISIALKADPVGMVVGFATAEGALKKFQSAFNSSKNVLTAGASTIAYVEDRIKKFGRNTMIAGLSVKAGLAVAVKAAADFENQMRQIQSLTQESDSALGKQGSVILKMSTELPQSANTLASAQYDLVSSGLKSADALHVLDVAAKGASAGQTSAADAAQAMAAAINAYGMSAKDATDISDIYFQTVNLGVLRYSDLTAGIGQWIGMAAQMKVPLADAAASLATMTLAGINAADAATYLSRVMQSFIAPTDAMKKAISDMGYADGQTMLQTLGLGKSVLALNDHFKGNAGALNAAYGEVQSFKGALAIAANEGKNYARVSAEINDKQARAGSTQKAFAEQSKALSFQWQVFVGQIKALAIQFGEPLLGPMKGILHMVSSIISIFLKIPGPIKTALVYITAIGATVLSITGALVAFGTGLAVKKLAFMGIAKGLEMIAMAGEGVGPVSGMLMKLSSSAAKQGSIWRMLTGNITLAFGAVKKLWTLYREMGTMNFLKVIIGSISGFGGTLRAAIQDGVLAFQSMRAIGGGTFESLGHGAKTFFDLMRNGGAAAGAAEEAAASGAESLAGGFGAMGLAGLGAVAAIAAVGAAAYMLIDRQDKAFKSGQRLQKQLMSKWDTTSFDGLTKSIRMADDQIDSLTGKIEAMGGEAGGGFSFSDFITGRTDQERLQGRLKETEAERAKWQKEMDQWKGISTAVFLKNAGFGAKDTSAETGDFLLKPTSPDHFNREASKISDQYTGMVQDVVSKIQVQAGQADKLDPIDLFFKGGTSAQAGIAKLGDEMSTQIMYNVNQMGMDLERLAKAKGLKMEDFLPGAPDAEKNTNELAKLYDTYRNLSPAAQKATIDFENMGDAADSSATNIDKLNSALQDTVDAALGAEGATDNLQQNITNIYKDVEDIKKRGGKGLLSNAMDFNSFSEDAIKLRGDWRGIVNDLVSETTQWAQSQKNVSGADIQGHLQGQIDMLKRYGHEMGLSDDFVQHYVQSLQDLINQNTVSIKFQDNIPEAQAKADGYIATILKTPDKINTFAVLYAQEGESALRTWLRSVGVADDKTIDTLIEVKSKDAYAQLKNWVSAVTSADAKSTISTIIQFKQKYGADTSSKEVQDFLKGTGMTDLQYTTTLNLIGNGAQELNIAKMTLADLNDDEADPKIKVENQEAITNIGEVQTAINALQGKDIAITINGQKPQAAISQVQRAINSGMSPGVANLVYGPNPYNTNTGTGEKLSSTNPKDKKNGANGMILRFYEDGGINTDKPNQHVAQIAKAGAMRVWAEPETGGEAYIPLAKAKRSRSMEILQQVANMFGMKLQKFAGGGINDPLSSRIAPEDPKKAKDAAKKTAKQNADDLKKWNNAVAQNQKEAQQKIDDNKKHMMDVEQFQFDMGQRTVEQHRAFLVAMTGQYAAYSDEWMSIQKDIKAIDDKAKDDQKNVDDALYAYGAVSLQKRIQQLQARAAAEKAFSQEWWQIANDIRDAQDKLAERQFNEGAIGLGDYVAYLKTQLAQAQKYSDRYMDLQQKIRDAEKKALDNKHQVGAINDQQYLASLERMRAGLVKFTDEWMDVNNKIVDIQKSALDKTTDLFSKFSSKMYVSASSMIRYLQKQIELAAKFNSNMQALQASGQYSADILKMIQDLGPQAGGGIAGALLAAIGSGQSGQISGLLNQAKSLGLNTLTFDTGGMLPVGYTIAYNGTGRPEPVGHDLKGSTHVGDVVGVKAEQVVVADAVDVAQLGERAAFSVSRRRL